jgi:hypothetical protein
MKRDGECSFQVIRLSGYQVQPIAAYLIVLARLWRRRRVFEAFAGWFLRRLSTEFAAGSSFARAVIEHVQRRFAARCWRGSR